MTIEILGTSGPQCKALAANAKLAADRLGIPYELFRVTNERDLMARGVMFMPALAVDGEIKSAGKVLEEAEVSTILTSVLV